MAHVEELEEEAKHVLMEWDLQDLYQREASDLEKPVFKRRWSKEYFRIIREELTTPVSCLEDIIVVINRVSIQADIFRRSMVTMKLVIVD